MFISLFLRQWYETRRQQSQRDFGEMHNSRSSSRPKKSFSNAFSAKANNLQLNPVGLYFIDAALGKLSSREPSGRSLPDLIVHYSLFEDV